MDNVKPESGTMGPDKAQNGTTSASGTTINAGHAEEKTHQEKSARPEREASFKDYTVGLLRLRARVPLSTLHTFMLTTRLENLLLCQRMGYPLDDCCCTGSRRFRRRMSNTPFLQDPAQHLTTATPIKAHPFDDYCFR